MCATSGRLKNRRSHTRLVMCATSGRLKNRRSHEACVCPVRDKRSSEEQAFMRGRGVCDKGCNYDCIARAADCP